MKMFCISLVLLAVAGVASADAVYDVGVVARPGQTVDLLFSFQVIGGSGRIDLAVSGVAGRSVMSKIACSTRPTGTYCPEETFSGAAAAGSQQVTQYSALFPNTSPVYITKLLRPDADTYGHLSWLQQSFHPVGAWPGPWPGPARYPAPSSANIPTQVPEPGSLSLLSSGLLAIGGMVRRRMFK